MQLSCLVIDDEPLAGKLLEDYISKIPNLHLKKSCFNADEAIAFLQDEKVDLAFVDINMPKVSGMELAAMLQKDIKIIFTTAYSEYALESYEYNVIDYLLKPITFKRFLKAIEKAEAFFVNEQKTSHADDAVIETADYIFIKSSKSIIRIGFSEILYFEALKEYVNVQTGNKKVLTYKRMKDVADKLPDNFLRVHKSYIINCDYITKIEGNNIIIGNTNIPVGLSYRSAFDAFIQAKAL
jgi:DNA-binding LytR/AlgR family response regulator